MTPWSFGALAARLGSLNGIAPSKGPAFQARLRNFHRLGFPIGFSAPRGRAAEYPSGHVIQMAVAVEMTQLGLTPERVVRVIRDDPFPMLMGVRMAAQAVLREHQARDAEGHSTINADPIYLYFDPAALSDLAVDDHVAPSPDDDRAAQTFFYGGAGVVADMMRGWGSGVHTRGAFINLTQLLNILGTMQAVNATDRRVSDEKLVDFLDSIIKWSEVEEDFLADEEAEDLLYTLYTRKHGEPLSGIARHAPRQILGKAVKSHLADLASELELNDVVAERVAQRILYELRPKKGQADVDPQA